MLLSEINSEDGYAAPPSGAPRHRVQFYKEEGYLLRSVADHLAESLARGGVALAFVTASHRDHIYDLLQDAGFGSATLERGCKLLDATDTLSRFMRRGVPDRQLFNSTLQQLLRPLQTGNRSDRADIAAFGEMVAVLWAEGKREAAIQLEQLWEEFTDWNPVSVLCAYPISYFSRADDQHLFARVCAHHSAVTPAETFASVAVEGERARELAELQQRSEALIEEVKARKYAELQLRANQAQLEGMVQQRTDALRRLSLQVLKLQDMERRRVARELHESVGQHFAGLKMNLGLAKSSPHDPNLWSKCDQLLEQCIDEVRTLSNLLHPPLIEDAGLPCAAEWYIRDFAKRSGVELNYEGLDVLSALSSSAQLVAFRALQESLMNIYRHARATEAKLTATRDGDSVILTVADNGRGMDLLKVEQFNRSGSGVGVGLTGIHERVRDLGGRCKIHSGSGGTSVSISLPEENSASQISAA